MTPEQRLRQRIVALSTGVLNRLPLKTFTRQLAPLIVPFADEIVQMSQEYVEAKRKEEDAVQQQEPPTEVRTPDGESGGDAKESKSFLQKLPWNRKSRRSNSPGSEDVSGQDQSG